MTNKMTNVAALTAILNGEPMTDEIRGKLESIKASYEKKASHKRVGPTKKAIENAAIGEKVLTCMAADVAYTSADIATLVVELDGATPQKVTPIMTALAKDGKVAVAKVKGKNVYTLA